MEVLYCSVVRVLGVEREIVEAILAPFWEDLTRRSASDATYHVRYNVAAGGGSPRIAKTAKETCSRAWLLFTANPDNNEDGEGEGVKNAVAVLWVGQWGQSRN